MRIDEVICEAKRVKTGYTAWVIAYTSEKIILGKRSPSSNNPSQWNFFGGNIDQGDTPIGTAVKEMEEETGLRIDAASLTHVATIGKAYYYSVKIANAGGIGTTDEISAVAQFKMTDLPNNLHSKTENFFNNLDRFFK